jgi:predicted nucleic acid-binding protein
MTSTIASDRSFVDTNIIVYAYDLDAGEKHTRSREIVAALWTSRTGALSTQVLQELYVTLARKLDQPLDHERAVRLVKSLSSWPVHVNGPDDIVTGAEVAQREQLSFWDGLIVAAAKQVGATRLLTEDLQTGRTIEGIQIVNPLV